MGKKLRIAQIAPYWFTVPPRDYGGTERVVSYVTEELVRRGHEVTLFAAPGSETQARLMSPVSASEIAKIQSYADEAFDAINTQVNATVFAQAGSFDIIHSHASHWAFPFAAVSATPVVYTVHNQLPRGDGAENALYERYRSLNFVSISQEFQTHMDLAYVGMVHHGIPLSYFPFSIHASERYLWLGRISKNKGELDAIDATTQAGVSLVLAGSVHEKTREYFDTVVKPKLMPTVELQENIRFEDTARLYGQAKAVLFPIAWREPFGLVMIESMACGTPVVAYGRGSVPEVVEDGVTGFVVDPKRGVAGLVEAIQKIQAMRPEEYAAMRQACRKHVEDHFTVEKMVDGYERVYASLLAK